MMMMMMMMTKINSTRQLISSINYTFTEKGSCNSCAMCVLKKFINCYRLLLFATVYKCGL